MTSLLNRFIFSHDFVGQQSWNLLSWCATHGASEFTLAMLSLQDSAAPFLDRAEKSLEPFALLAAPREFVIGDPLVRPAKLWSLSSDAKGSRTYVTLRGLIEATNGATDTCADLHISRDGELFTPHGRTA